MIKNDDWIEMENFLLETSLSECFMMNGILKKGVAKIWTLDLMHGSWWLSIEISCK